MKNIPTQYFSGEYLEPYSPAIKQATSSLSDATLQRIQLIATELRNKQYVILPLAEIRQHPDLAVFIAIIQAFGAIQIVETGSEWHLSTTSQLSRNMAYSLFLFLRDGFAVFDDWTRRSRTAPDRITAAEFLHQMELQRIEYSKRSGIRVEVLDEVPVSFAIIKARSGKKAVYLLELNKDWNRYNFVGGKQEPQDQSDYHRTLLREIEEEIGVSRRDVKLTPLTDKPLDGYSLSGYRGALAHYPCMLFLAHFQKPFTIQAKHKWFSEEELRRNNDPESNIFMINPIYTDFLFNKLTGGLEGLDYSFNKPIDSLGWNHYAIEILKKHSEWIIALILIIAAIISLIKVFW